MLFSARLRFSLKPVQNARGGAEQGFRMGRILIFSKGKRFLFVSGTYHHRSY